MKTPGYEKLALPWLMVLLPQAKIPVGDRRHAKARADIE
jgi:hypothetical protein